MSKISSKLSLKFLIAIFATVSITLAISHLSSVSSEIALVKKQTDDFGNTIAELLGKSCAVLIVEDETVLLEKALDIVASKENILFTKITDLDGEIVAESPDGLSIDELDQASLFTYQRILTVPTDESKELGLLTLGISGNSEKDLVYTLIGTIITEAMVSFLLITIATLIIFHVIVSKPLSYIEQQARRVGSGDFEEEISLSSKDELGHLAQTLDTMRANLKESYQALEDHKVHLQEKVDEAVAELNTLTGLLPICAHCKSIRDDKGSWEGIENYIDKRSDAQFSHCICPDCLKKHYPTMDK